MKTLISIFLILFASCRYAEKESYIVPRDYVGNAIIFTNVKSGTAKLYKANGSRIYQFPISGLLFSRFKETYGIIDRNFFYNDQNGTKLVGIVYDENKSNLDNNKVYAFYGDDFTITFPKRDTIGVQVITICRPGDFDVYNNDIFLNHIKNIKFFDADLTEMSMLKIRSELIKTTK